MPLPYSHDLCARSTTTTSIAHACELASVSHGATIAACHGDAPATIPTTATVHATAAVAAVDAAATGHDGAPTGSCSSQR